MATLVDDYVTLNKRKLKSVFQISFASVKLANVSTCKIPSWTWTSFQECLPFLIDIISRNSRDGIVQCNRLIHALPISVVLSCIVLPPSRGESRRGGQLESTRNVELGWFVTWQLVEFGYFHDILGYRSWRHAHHWRIVSGGTLSKLETSVLSILRTRATNGIAVPAVVIILCSCSGGLRGRIVWSYWATAQL